MTDIRELHAIVIDPTMTIISPPTEQSDCVTFTIRLQPQFDLELVGVGAASLVYKVDDDIILKARRVFERPASDASSRDQWFYASESLFHFNLLEDERTVMRLLEQRPHSNIVEAIDTDHNESIYLRRYLSLSELEVPVTTRSDLVVPRYRTRSRTYSQAWRRTFRPAY